MKAQAAHDPGGGVWRPRVRAFSAPGRHVDDVEFSCEDATRSDADFLVEVFRAAAGAGATTLNLPDTVGYCMPQEYADLLRYVMSEVDADVVWSVHTHDDLGLAVANALAGVEAGARQVEVAVNGIGERAGQLLARGSRDGDSDARGATDRWRPNVEHARRSRAPRGSSRC